MSTHDGLSVLKLVNDRKYALVVLDIMLPEMKCFDVCRKLRGEEIWNNLTPQNH
jgi:DNA-binding response OmpR family regulator